MQYRLKKLAVSSYSSVPAGSSVVGNLQVYDVESKTFIEDCTIDDVKVGRRLSVSRSMASFIVTSDITEIIKKDKVLVEFKTITSTYTLCVKN